MVEFEGVLDKAGVPHERIADAAYQIPVTIEKQWGTLDPLHALMSALEGAPSGLRRGISLRIFLMN